MVVPGTMFEELGFNYIGPVDGHDVIALVQTLTNMRDLKGPQLLHIMTKKVGVTLPQSKIQSVGMRYLNLIQRQVLYLKAPMHARRFQKFLGTGYVKKPPLMKS